MKNLFSTSNIIAICLVLSLFPLNSGQALFFDFEDEDQLDEWNIVNGTWQIEEDDVNNSNIVSGEAGNAGNDIILAIGDENWTDYTLEFEANVTDNDNISIIFRFHDINNYISFILVLRLNESWWFVKKNGAFDQNLGKRSDKLGVNANEWHKYKLVVEGMEARIFVDDEEALEPLEIWDEFENGGPALRQ